LCKKPLIRFLASVGAVRSPVAAGLQRACGQDARLRFFLCNSPVSRITDEITGVWPVSMQPFEEAQSLTLFGMTAAPTSYTRHYDGKTLRCGISKLGPQGPFG